MAIKLGNTSINKMYLGSTEIEKAYLGSDIVFESSRYQISLNSLESDFISFDNEQVLQDGKTFEITTRLETTFTPSYITSGLNSDWGLYINTNRTCILKIGSSDFHTFTFPYQFELGTFCNAVVSRSGDNYDVSINNQISNGSWAYSGGDAFRVKDIAKRSTAFVDMIVDSFKMNGVNYGLNQGLGSTFQGVTLNSSSSTPNYINDVMWGENTNLPIDIYTFLGQSNQDGRGNLADVPKYLTYDFGVEWLSVSTFTNLVVGVDSPNTSYFQCCSKFAYDLREQNPTKDFRILQVSKGGTSLHTDWAVGGDERNAYDTKRKQLEGTLFNYNYVSTMWMQGEADATQQVYADDYYDNLTEFVTYCKSETKNALFIDAKIRTLSTGVPFSSTVNAAKQQVFDDGLSNGTFSTEAYPMLPDNLHYTTDGLILLADDFRSLTPSYVKNTYENEYNSILSRALQEGYQLPGDALKTKGNSLISTMKIDGVYSRLDTLAILTDSNEDFALIDWIDTDNIYETFDNIDWNNEGFASSSSPTGYINTNYKPSLGVNKTSVSSSYFSSASHLSILTGGRALYGVELGGSWTRLTVNASVVVGSIQETSASNNLLSPNSGVANRNYLSETQFHSMYHLNSFG